MNEVYDAENKVDGIILVTEDIPTYLEGHNRALIDLLYDVTLLANVGRRDGAAPLIPYQREK